jgi:D-lactate dehydrogenase
VLTDDPAAWLSDLKTTLPVEEEVDRCVECGFCEPVCPSRSLTTTPRQRIVLRREMALAQARGDTALVDELRRDYEYDGVQTCAVDGMCATACPVLINTGDLVRRLRAATETPTSNRVWSFAAGHWSGATRAASAALTAADRIPAPVPIGLSRLGRTIAGAEQVPLYDPGLSGGGPRRGRVVDAGADAVLFPACVGTMFGGGVSAALLRLCERAGVRLRTPDDVDELCCGTPWKSKGHLDGHARMAERVRGSVLAATEDGRLPLVVDASSCTEGLLQMLAGSGIEVRDVTEYVVERVLPRLTVTAPVPAVVVHPTCSSTAAGSTDALVQIARFVSEDVTVPGAWGCCGFAGDRGLLHPELTASATAPEASEVAALDVPPGTAYVSSNRTCEIGMTRATGQDYRHVLEVLDQATG